MPTYYSTMINGELASVHNMRGKWRLFVPEQCVDCGQAEDNFSLVQYAGLPYLIRCACGAEYLLKETTE